MNVCWDEQLEVETMGTVFVRVREPEVGLWVSCLWMLRPHRSLLAGCRRLPWVVKWLPSGAWEVIPMGSFWTTIPMKWLKGLQVFLALVWGPMEIHSNMGVWGDFNEVLLREWETGNWVCWGFHGNITLRIWFPLQARWSILPVSIGNNHFDSLASSEVLVLT